MRIDSVAQAPMLVCDMDPIRRSAMVFTVLGGMAALAPWLAHAVDLSPHRTHSDLWFALGGFVLAYFASGIGRPGPRAAAWIVLGSGECLVTLVNMPRLTEAARRAGEPGVAGFLGEAAVQRLWAYGIVALAGLALVSLGVRLLVTRRVES